MIRSVKITSVIMLVVLSAMLIYLTFALDEKQPTPVTLVELNGNIHLPKDEYMKFAGLNQITEGFIPDLAILRDRLSKHPYIETVDIFVEGSALKIDLQEKRFEAIVFSDNKQYFITESSIMLPVLPYTLQINYPIITNPLIEESITAMSSVKNQKDVITGLKIVSAVKLVNPELYDRLSEINLRSGKDILLQFSDFEYPIIIGRGSEIRKVLSFNKLWDYLKGNEINTVINYVDLRYSEHIFMGFNDSVASDEDDKI